MRLKQFKDSQSYSLFKYLNPEKMEELKVDFYLVASQDQKLIKRFLNLRKLEIKFQYQ